jgi:hypothetical protein
MSEPDLDGLADAEGVLYVRPCTGAGIDDVGGANDPEPPPDVVGHGCRCDLPISSLAYMACGLSGADMDPDPAMLLSSYPEPDLRGVRWYPPGVSSPR